jgi:hypothetical protein
MTAEVTAYHPVLGIPEEDSTVGADSNFAACPSPALAQKDSAYKGFVPSMN